MVSVGFKVLGAQKKKKVMLDPVYYGVFIGHTKLGFFNLFTWVEKDKWDSVSKYLYPKKIKRNAVLLNLAST